MNSARKIRAHSYFASDNMSAREYKRYCMRPMFIVHWTTIHMCIETCVVNRVDFMAMAALIVSPSVCVDSVRTIQKQ